MKTLPRPLTFAQAKANYPHRFTCEHVPAWAAQSFRQQGGTSDAFPAPQYATDQEWYDKTIFPGESELADKHHCYSDHPSWPLGQSLPTPYQIA